MAYTCFECSKEYTDKSKYNKHMKKHTPKKNNISFTKTRRKKSLVTRTR